MLLPAEIDSQTLSLHATRCLVVKHDIGNLTDAFTQSGTRQCIISQRKSRENVNCYILGELQLVLIDKVTHVEG